MIAAKMQAARYNHASWARGLGSARLRLGSKLIGCRHCKRKIGPGGSPIRVMGGQAKQTPSFGLA